MLTSICRSIVTICSALYLLIGMTSFSSKWIVSPSTWYKKRRSGHFICEVFQGISDAEILEIFARLNQYSVPLNTQELRNGKYFGFFKQSAYRLAHTYVDFWRKHKLFSERAMARMTEVEFTSELMIAALDGLQDKKKSIDT